MHDLGTLGGNAAGGEAINNSGDIVGWADTASGDRHAFLDNGSNMQDLGTLGGSESWAMGINAGGDVTGWADTAGGAQDAFFYDGTTMHDLGTLAGFTGSYGYSVNDSGDIVGIATSSTGNVPFLYTPAGGMVNLNSLLPANSGWGACLRFRNQRQRANRRVWRVHRFSPRFIGPGVHSHADTRALDTLAGQHGAGRPWPERCPAAPAPNNGRIVRARPKGRRHRVDFLRAQRGHFWSGSFPKTIAFGLDEPQNGTLLTRRGRGASTAKSYWGNPVLRRQCVQHADATTPGRLGFPAQRHRGKPR